MGFVFRCLSEFKIPWLLPEDWRYWGVIYTGHNTVAVIPPQKFEDTPLSFKLVLCHGEVVHKTKFWITGAFSFAVPLITSRDGSPQGQLRLPCSSVPCRVELTASVGQRTPRDNPVLGAHQNHPLPPLMLGILSVQSVSSNWSVCNPIEATVAVWPHKNYF